MGYLVMVAMLIYHGIKGNVGTAIAGPIILTIGFLALKLFFYGNSFKLYSAGGQAINELKGEKMEVFENIGVRITDFDLASQKNSFPPTIRKTIYDFNKADLVLTAYSMVLMGKSESFGGEAYAYPVEILMEQSGWTSLPKAQILSWAQSDTSIRIQIEDYNYKKHINIETKDKAEELKQWLTAPGIQAKA